MKCPFCVADNPSHANFCMNCGSPLDLKACEDCGGINRKSAATCQMCGSFLGEPNTAAEPVVAAAPLPHHVQESEALAQETQTFKQLFAEIERDVNQQLARSNIPPPAVSPSDFEPGAVTARPPGTPILVEPPAYLRQMLSERAAQQTKRGRGRRIVTAGALLIAVAGFGYYASVGPHPTVTTSKTQARAQPKTDAPIKGQISPQAGNDIQAPIQASSQSSSGGESAKN